MSEYKTENAKSLIEEVENQIEKIRGEELFNPKVLKGIEAPLGELKKKITNLEALEAHTESIREEILTPVKKELSIGTRFSRLGLWVGLFAILMGVAGTAISVMLTRDTNKQIQNKEASNYFYPDEFGFIDIVQEIDRMSEQELSQLTLNSGFETVNYSAVVDITNYEYRIGHQTSRLRINPTIYDIDFKLVKKTGESDFFFYAGSSSKPWIELSCFERDYAVIDKSPKAFGNQNARKMAIVDVSRFSVNDTIDLSLRMIIWNSLQSSSDSQYNWLSHAVRSEEKSFDFTIRLDAEPKVDSAFCEWLYLNPNEESWIESGISVSLSQEFDYQELKIEVPNPDVGKAYKIKWPNSLRNKNY